MDYYFIITIVYPGCQGATMYGPYSKRGATRGTAYEEIFGMATRKAKADTGRTAVLFFSLEPDELPR